MVSFTVGTQWEWSSSWANVFLTQWRMFVCPRMKIVRCTLSVARWGLVSITILFSTLFIYQAHTDLLDSRTLQPVRKIPSRNSGCGIRSVSFKGNILTIGTGIGLMLFWDLRACKFLESTMNSNRYKGKINGFICLIYQFVSPGLWIWKHHEDGWSETRSTWTSTRPRSTSRPSTPTATTPAEPGCLLREVRFSAALRETTSACGSETPPWQCLFIICDLYKLCNLRQSCNKVNNTDQSCSVLMKSEWYWVVGIIFCIISVNELHQLNFCDYCIDAIFVII